MPLLNPRNYTGVETNWHAKNVKSWRPILQNRLRWLEIAVEWEYALNLIHTAAAEAKMYESPYGPRSSLTSLTVIAASCTAMSGGNRPGGHI